jgi:hypothetical protein
MKNFEVVLSTNVAIEKLGVREEGLMFEVEE